VLGSIYVVLALGIGAVFMSLGLYLQTVERVGRRLPAAGWLRFAVAATPVVVIFLLLEVLLWIGATSFAGPLNLVGTLIVPLLGGVFPMLLVAAARRRGERVPGTSLAWLGNPLVVGAVAALYLGGVVAQALFIWTDPAERIVALATAGAILVLIAVSMRRGSFRSRTVVELRADEPPGAGADLSVVADGRAVSDRRLADLAGVNEVAVELPSDRPAELYVWAHRPTRGGDDEPLPAEVDAGSADQVVIRLLRPG
jgi:hypothetical protein